MFPSGSPLQSSDHPSDKNKHYSKELSVAGLNNILRSAIDYHSQFGFCKAKSTIDAIKKIVNTACEAIDGKRWRQGYKKYYHLYFGH